MPPGGLGVPVTEVTETLPDGTDYLTWQRNTVDRLPGCSAVAPVSKP